MAPKTKGKGAASSSGSPAFDKNRFWDADAAANFVKLSEKTMHKERGMDFRDFDAPTMVAARDRGWGAFVRQPQEAVMSLVREFYANLLVKHDKYKVKVRGKMVAFDSKTINAMYRMPNLANDDYTTFKAGEFPADEVLHVLCDEGAEWKTNWKHEPVTFLSRFLKREANNWHEFVVARMMPSGHTYEVTVVRATLLYCLVAGRSIDAGRVLQESIENVVKGSSITSLPHSSLITELCQYAGIVWDPQEQRLPTRAPISLLAPLKRDRKKAGESSTSQEPQRQPLQPTVPDTLPQPSLAVPSTVHPPFSPFEQAVLDRFDALEGRMTSYWAMQRQHMAYVHDFHAVLAQNYPPTGPSGAAYPAPPPWSHEPVSDDYCSNDSSDDDDMDAES